MEQTPIQDVPAEVLRLQSLLDEGHTQNRIAELLGVSIRWVERRVARFRLRTHRTGPRPGSSHPQWAGGRGIDKHGYVHLWMPLHPQANHLGRYWEHRAVMEISLSRYLERAEVVHHRDDHPRHNWPSNLEVFASNGEHLHHELFGISTPNPKGGARPTSRNTIPGAYRCTERLRRCPEPHETLAQCPSETLERLAWYIESFRPTSEQRRLPRRSFLRSGAHRDPFGWRSTE